MTEIVQRVLTGMLLLVIMLTLVLAAVVLIQAIAFGLSGNTYPLIAGACS